MSCNPPKLLSYYSNKVNIYNNNCLIKIPGSQYDPAPSCVYISPNMVYPTKKPGCPPQNVNPPPTPYKPGTVCNNCPESYPPKLLSYYSNKVNIYNNNCLIKLPSKQPTPAPSCVYISPVLVYPPKEPGCPPHVVKLPQPLFPPGTFCNNCPEPEPPTIPVDNTEDLIIDNTVSDTIDLSTYANLKLLNLSGSNIKSINNLPKSVQNIDLSFSSLEDLQDLSGYSNLVTLILYEATEITEMPILPNTIRVLDLSATSITELPDTLPLSINILDLSTLDITTLPNLSNLSNLTQLIIHNLDGITEFPDVPQTIEHIDITNSGITLLPVSLSILLPQLKTLDISNTGIASLPLLPNTLENLYIIDTNINSLPILPDGLKRLYIGGTQISSLPILPSGLIELDISRTTISTIPSIPNTLKMLDISESGMLSLPSLPDTLLELYAAFSLITNIPTLPSSLILLDISNTTISILPNLPLSLNILDISHTQISSIVSLPPKLLALYLSSTNINLISDLPPEITVLNASKTKIITLPTIPKSLINIDISNCIISQRNADTIITNLVNNGVNNGNILIMDQYKLENDTTTRKLNNIGSIWQQLKNPPFNWDVI
jgi:Leucine-rich repeat (LRR) protein/ribosomal protein L35AE/L33A